MVLSKGVRVRLHTYENMVTFVQLLKSRYLSFGLGNVIIDECNNLVRCWGGHKLARHEHGDTVTCNHTSDPTADRVVVPFLTVLRIFYRQRPRYRIIRLPWLTSGAPTPSLNLMLSEIDFGRDFQHFPGLQLLRFTATDLAPDECALFA